MKPHKDVESILLTNSDIVVACEKIAQRISKDYSGKKPILVCMLKGGVPFCSELLKHLTIDVELDFIRFKSYKGSNQTGKCELINDISFDVKDKDVILIDDILDTGVTVYNAARHILNKGVRSLEVATLLDKPGMRTEDVNVKYIGYTVPNKYLVGFGLDWSEQYRALPYVGILKKEIYEKEDK